MEMEDKVACKVVVVVVLVATAKVLAAGSEGTTTSDSATFNLDLADRILCVSACVCKRPPEATFR